MVVSMPCISNATNARTNAKTLHITSCTASTSVVSAANRRSISGFGLNRSLVATLGASSTRASAPRMVMFRPKSSSSNVDSRSRGVLVSSNTLM